MELEHFLYHIKNAVPNELRITVQPYVSNLTTIHPKYISCIYVKFAKND